MSPIHLDALSSLVSPFVTRKELRKVVLIQVNYRMIAQYLRVLASNRVEF
jgi:hypothetical protein